MESKKIFIGQLWAIKDEIDLPYKKVIVCYLDEKDKSLVTVKPVHGEKEFLGKKDLKIEDKNVEKDLYVAIDIEIKIPTEWLDTEADMITVYPGYSITNVSNIDHKDFCRVPKLSDNVHYIFKIITEELLKK